MDTMTSEAHAFNPTILREDDIRGIVGDTLTNDDAYAIGRAFGTILSETYGGGRYLLDTVKGAETLTEALRNPPGYLCHVSFICSDPAEPAYSFARFCRERGRRA